MHVELETFFEDDGKIRPDTSFSSSSDEDRCIAIFEIDIGSNTSCSSRQATEMVDTHLSWLR